MSRLRAFRFCVLACFGACFLGPLFAEEKSQPLVVHVPAIMQWRDAPPGLPPGAKMVVLEGDPGKEGPFVFRLRFPAGYRIAPHRHPAMERCTVISGTLHIALGDNFDESKGHDLPAGSYGTWAGGHSHYGWVTEDTVIQLHGVGPWSVEYVNPADDPRHK